MYKRILVTLDGSEFAERVLPHVEALAAKFGSLVVLLRATNPDRSLIVPAAGTMRAAGPVTDLIPIAEAERRAASLYLDGIMQQLKGRNLTVEYEVVQGDAAGAIVEAAGRLRADLIAMTTHGEGGLGRLVFGSVADAVLRKASSPVLLVRVNETRTTPQAE